MKIVTKKGIYSSRMCDLLLPPKVELKYPTVNFHEQVYLRLGNPVLEVKQKDLLFSLIHEIYRNEQDFSSRTEQRTTFVLTKHVGENILCKILSISSALATR